MRISLTSIAIIIGILLAAAVPAQQPESDAVRGAKLYSANCGSCHNFRSPIELDDRDWSVVMTHMRVVAGIPGDQARAIEAFLQAGNNSVRALPPVASPPAGVRQGNKEALSAPPLTALDGDNLLQRNGCQGCHVIGGIGGTAGPNLDTVFRRRDERWVQTKIMNPRGDNPESVMPQFGLTEAEADAIVEALRRKEPSH